VSIRLSIFPILMGKTGIMRRLIRQSICYHPMTDRDAQQACADRFFEAARAVLGGIRLGQLSEDFFASEPVA
jgi:hypothetical protein